MQLQIIVFAVFISALAGPMTSIAELIEPTRTLHGASKTTGNLTILSEPPDLEVTLDDSHIGNTPIFLRRLESGIHKLRIQESETDVYVEPDETVQISLFKGEFIILPAAKKEPVKRQGPKEKKVNEARNIPLTPPAEQKKALTPWEQFVDGSLNHF